MGALERVSDLAKFSEERKFLKSKKCNFKITKSGFLVSEAQELSLPLLPSDSPDFFMTETELKGDLGVGLG